MINQCLHPLPHVFQNVQMEEAGSSPRPETPSTLTETEGEMEGSLLEVDLDSYQTTLEEVLTWLLSAEDALQIQEEVSDDVEEVKEQFHTHEVGGEMQAGININIHAHIDRGANNIVDWRWYPREKEASPSQLYMLRTCWECQEFC